MEKGVAMSHTNIRVSRLQSDYGSRPRELETSHPTDLYMDVEEAGEITSY